MENFIQLQAILMQKFAIFRNDAEIFQTRSKEILNAYSDDLDGGNLYLKHPEIFREFCDYMDILFATLSKTTDYIGNMMLHAQNLQKLFKDDLNDLFTSSLNVSEETITGFKNGFKGVDFPPSPNKSVQEKEISSTKAITTYSTKYELPCGSVDISIFKPGTIIPIAVVSSLRLEDLSFHICVLNNQVSQLSGLYDAKDRQVFRYMPPAGLIFGMKIDGGIVRAIRCDLISTDKVLLPDFGDIVKMNENLNEIYHLTIDEQRIPALAIPCKLYNADVTRNDDNQKLKTYLSSLLYVQKSFYIVDVLDGILYLKEYDTSIKRKNLEEKTPVMTFKTNDQRELLKNKNSNQLSAEELEMLNEEPLNTSNALKAVMGYVPKDDQRICRFYDPKIGTCFKGNTCRQEHTPLLKGHYTKDTTLANVYAENPLISSILYNPGQVLQIIVTYIKSVEYFYGNIINGQMKRNEFIWNDIPSSKYMKKVPYEYDIVLAKYDDGRWYRAQVLDVDESEKFISVFYIDYGNQQTVPLSNIAKCDEDIAKFPEQAVQFRLANVRAIPEETEALQVGIRMLDDKIFNHDVKIIVVSHYDDLVIRFMDKPFSDIPQQLAGLQCVELIEML